MNRTLLISAGSIAGAAALVGGMTFASFNDTQVSMLPSVVSAGTLQLNQEGLTDPIQFKDMKPGDVANFTIDLRNAGTLAGNLYAKVNSVVGFEDGCDVKPGSISDALTETQVERIVDTNCMNLLSGGDLTKYLSYSMVDGDGEHQMAADGSGNVDLGALAAKATGSYTLRVKFANEAMADGFTVQQQNDAQGDGAALTLKFALVQS